MIRQIARGLHVNGGLKRQYKMIQEQKELLNDQEMNIDYRVVEKSIRKVSCKLT
ncbi:MAG: hypothetical protein WAR39_10635 [Prevotella sp.]